MKQYTKIYKGGTPMVMQKNQAPTQESAHPTFIKRPIVDWSEEKIVVNGHSITVIFPDEGKPLSRQN